MLTETYTPNQGPWVELPAPTAKKWDFDNRSGSLVHQINPHFLSYWNPDVTARGFLLLGLGFGLIAIGFLLVISIASVSISFSKNGEIEAIFILLIVFAFCLVGVVLSVIRALPPPTYFNRHLQQVMQYQKVPGRKGEWLIWDWSNITPAIRQAHIYSSAGRSTMYVLVLMQLETATKKILRSFGAYSSEQVKLPCVQAWEFMRRYMNEPPENVPPAYIPPFEFDRKTWAVRCQMETMQWGINPDGTLRGWFNKLYLPVIGTFLYAPMWATLWIEKTAPKVPLPPEIAAQNAWDESQPNPYKVDYAHSGPTADYPVAQVYERIKLRHWVMTALGFGFYGGLLLAMMAYGWVGTF